MAVIVVATSVTRQDTHKASKARHINIKGRNCADISSRAPEANKQGCTRKINMSTPSVKKPLQEQQTHDKSRRHTKPNTTNGCTQLLRASQNFFGFEVHWHDRRLHTTSSWVTSSHRDTDIHQQVAINFGPASITACVTGSTRVLDELLRDEEFNLSLSRVTDSSVMQMRPVRMSIRSSGTLPLFFVIASAYMPLLSTHRTVAPCAFLLA